MAEYLSFQPDWRVQVYADIWHQGQHVDTSQPALTGGWWPAGPNHSHNGELHPSLPCWGPTHMLILMITRSQEAVSRGLVSWEVWLPVISTKKFVLSCQNSQAIWRNKKSLFHWGWKQKLTCKSEEKRNREQRGGDVANVWGKGVGSDRRERQRQK